MVRVAGISGVAGAGKDTLYTLVSQELKKDGFSVFRVALADALKQDMNDFLIEKLGISAHTSNQEEKKLIRPLLVAYGKVKRIQSKGTYWTNIAQNSVNELLSGNQKNVVIVTDIRYDEYENDELEWLQKKNRGILAHVSRQLADNSILQPPNDEERANDPKMKAKCDFGFTWKTYLPAGTIGEDQIRYAKEFATLLKNA